MSNPVSRGKKPFLSQHDLERRFQLTSTYRHLRHRLGTTDQWMPRYLMENPDTNPKDIIKGMHNTVGEVVEELRQLDGNGIVAEAEKIPLPDERLPPIRDRVQHAIAEARWLKQLRDRGALIVPGDLLQGEPPEEEPPNVVSGVASGGWLCCDMTDIAAFYAYPIGENWDDFYAEFIRDYWEFDAFQSIDYGILRFRTDIRRCDYAALQREVALEFTCFAAPFDGILTWQARTKLNVPYYLNADEASFSVDWTICEQANHTRQPYNYEFYSISGFDEAVQDGQNVGYRETERTLSGAITVQEGDKSAVYLGVKVRIDVDDNGRSGTKRDWGSFQVFRPEAADFWGIEYWYSRT